MRVYVFVYYAIMDVKFHCDILSSVLRALLLWYSSLTWMHPCKFEAVSSLLQEGFGFICRMVTEHAPQKCHVSTWSSKHLACHAQLTESIGMQFLRRLRFTRLSIKVVLFLRFWIRFWGPTEHETNSLREMAFEPGCWDSQGGRWRTG